MEIVSTAVGDADDELPLEFFLHHEGTLPDALTTHSPNSHLVRFTEQFHSTPETQTDESYNHAEDIEHFAHHETIELLEAEREAKYQGISVEEVLRAHEPPTETIALPRPKITRGAPKQDPAVKYKNIDKEKENQSEWGTGEQGYKQPKSPAEKMRSVFLSQRDLYMLIVISQEKPAIQGTRISSDSAGRRWTANAQERMQYKFRRSWGDF